MTIDDLFDRRIPLAICAALLMQAGTAVWWASAKESDDRFQQQRIEHLEQTTSEMRDNETQILERLARIEERVNGEASVLDRIERQLGVPRR
jgi:hypothetical protein